MNRLNGIVYYANFGYLCYGICNLKKYSAKKQENFKKISCSNAVVLVIDTLNYSFARSTFFCGLSILAKICCMLANYNIFGTGLFYDILGNEYLKIVGPQKYNALDMITVAKQTGLKDTNNQDIVSTLIYEKNSIEGLKYLIQDPLSSLSDSYHTELAKASYASSIIMLIAVFY